MRPSPVADARNGQSEIILMTTVQIPESEINALVVEFGDRLEGKSPNDARAVAIEFWKSQQRDAEKKAKQDAIEELRRAPVKEYVLPSKAVKANYADVRRLEREADTRKRQDAKKAEQHRLGNDLWDALSAKDARRFARLEIGQNRDKHLLATVSQKNRHAAIIALMYHVGQWGVAHGKITAETPLEQVQQGIFKRVKPQQDFIATYRTKGGQIRHFKDAGPIKDDSELMRLAGTVARKILDSLKDWRDEDAARRGGIQSGIVRRDKAEVTTWKRVIELAETGMPKAQIAREVGISRKHVYSILKQGIRFSNGKARF